MKLHRKKFIKYCCKLNLQFFTAGEQNLLDSFETVLAYIPDDAPSRIKTTIKSHSTWFARALDFSASNSLACSSRLFSMTAAVYGSLDIEDGEYYHFKPNVLTNLNLVVETENPGISSTVVTMTNRYLFKQAQRMSISASQFASVLNSTAWCLRPSYEQSFVAFEEMLKFQDKVDKMAPTDIAEMISEIDFSKLSPSTLDRESKNELIPQNVTMAAAVKVCLHLQFQLAEKSQENAMSHHRIEELQEELQQVLRENNRRHELLHVRQKNRENRATVQRSFK
jgi:hypothetical protein